MILSKVPRHEGELGSGGIPPRILTSELDGSEWSALRSGCFTPWKETPILIG